LISLFTHLFRKNLENQLPVLKDNINKMNEQFQIRKYEVTDEILNSEEQYGQNKNIS